MAVAVTDATPATAPDDLTFRKLIGPRTLPAELDRATLGAAYAWPDDITTVRANMIASLDGSITGPDGLSGTLSDRADRAVFDTLRAGCDAIVVGAGTARAENYGPPGQGRLLVVVSRSGALPERLLAHPERVVLAQAGGAEKAADKARAILGAERVWVLGGVHVSPGAVLERLHVLGRRRILVEGGPSLLGRWLADNRVDELCLTRVARLLGGGPSLLPEPVGDLPARIRLLLESGGTLLGRWQLAGRTGRD